VNVTLIFFFVIVAKGEVRLHAHVLGLFGSEIESENVVLEKFLTHHLVEDGGDSFLCQGWVGHSDNGFEVLAIEDCLLLFNETKLLIFDMNLSA